VKGKSGWCWINETLENERSGKKGGWRLEARSDFKEKGPVVEESAGGGNGEDRQWRAGQKHSVQLARNSGLAWKRKIPESVR